jgi:hypothetical protein
MIFNSFAFEKCHVNQLSNSVSIHLIFLLDSDFHAAFTRIAINSAFVKVQYGSN